MINYIDGNIFEFVATGNYDMFVHGCNCLHTMGAGVALSAKKFCHALYEADIKQTDYADRSKLGSMSSVVMNNNGHPTIMANGYTQFDWKHGPRGESPVDMEAIKKLFTRLNSPEYRGYRIIIPKIGAGLAGGDWNEIEAVINDVASQADITVVNYVQ